jgi:hypothetical protein
VTAVTAELVVAVVAAAALLGVFCGDLGVCISVVTEAELFVEAGVFFVVTGKGGGITKGVRLGGGFC